MKSEIVLTVENKKVLTVKTGKKYSPLKKEKKVFTVKKGKSTYR